MTSPVVFVGWGADDRVPGFYAESKFAQGAVSAAGITKKCLLTGTKLAAGSATSNQDINQIFSNDDADAFYGAGSEIARQCYKALLVPGTAVYGAPATEAGGAAAGVLTITCVTNSVATGTYQFWLDGDYYSVSIGATDNITTLAANIALAINANARGPYTAVGAVGVCTITKKSKGIRGNDGSCFQDVTKCTACITTFTLGGGGTSLTGGGIRPATGSGVEVLTTLLSVLFPGVYDYQGWAQNDATSVAAVKAQVATKAGILEGRLEEYCIASNGTLAAATSLAQTTLNDFRANWLWQINAESHPSEIAASMASKRAATEGSDPVHVYDGEVLPGIAPNRAPADIANHATLKSALNNSVTPIQTVGSNATITMLITTYSLNGSNPDYRCLQSYYVSMPDYARLDLALRWLLVIKPANPRVQDDLPISERQPVAGVWTPLRATGFMRDLQREYEANGWFSNVDAFLATAGYNLAAKRIEGIFPCPVTAGDHQFGVSVRSISQ